ncbi:MAG: S-methyl-5'-thioadenosine phosphorylase [Acidothermus cellulolyticus]|nr:S-methyl-5'-thioadenosine phosphorylase [Acidothermus cellulolyticus]
MATTSAVIGVLGGTGLYELLDDAQPAAIDTPFGASSEPPLIGKIAGRAVAFIPRHGKDHRFPPHLVPYQANIWALHALGVRQILAVAAVGSLREEIGVGRLVIPDQVVDRTYGRPQTYFDRVGGVFHAPFADPYCPVGRRTVIDAARRHGWEPVETGTLVVVEGPRFSSRAESRFHAAQGWSIVGMTGQPEAALARELGLCYTAVALVTDVDAGIREGEGVTEAEVIAQFTRSVERIRTTIATAIELLPERPECDCAQKGNPDLAAALHAASR